MVVGTVAPKQEEKDATVAVTKKLRPVYFKKEALAPSPLSAMQTTLTKLALEVAALKQEVAFSEKDSLQLHWAENPLHRYP